MIFAQKSKNILYKKTIEILYSNSNGMFLGMVVDRRSDARQKSCCNVFHLARHDRDIVAEHLLADKRLQRRA